MAVRVFCDWCNRDLGAAPPARQQDSSRERGQHVAQEIRLATDGAVAAGGPLGVQINVVPRAGQHVCTPCAQRAATEAIAHMVPSDDPAAAEGDPA